MLPLSSCRTKAAISFLLLRIPIISDVNINYIPFYVLLYTSNMAWQWRGATEKFFRFEQDDRLAYTKVKDAARHNGDAMRRLPSVPERENLFRTKSLIENQKDCANLVSRIYTFSFECRESWRRNSGKNSPVLVPDWATKRSLVGLYKNIFGSWE